MVKKENSSNTLWVVFISICLGFVIRINSVLNADQLFSVFNIDILILFVAIIGLIILLNNKKKIRGNFIVY
ncbi:hypothetical protein [Peribacillus butanolivorans]|uniref:Uncharacterized protein n=1 Tax=Peribacillus butanolivorans TaxID=421767 RepID=A0ABN5N5W9_9BACI|nr:hypothetical protein [Peribacillus butanolivorans]AXN40826.1 hypothetical protein DTO10_22245 [Peribacillus butanolivorans]